MSDHHNIEDFFGEDRHSDAFETSEVKREPVNGDVVNIVAAQLKDAERQARKKPRITGKPFQQFICMSVWYQYQSVTIDRFYDSDWNRNICDYLIQSGNMTAWGEAKTTSTSMPFHDANNPKKSKFKQQPLLLAKSIRCKSAGTRDSNMIGVLVEFKRKGVPFAVWWVDIDDVLYLEKTLDKKSFNTHDLHELYLTALTHNTYPVSLYKPPRARKFYLDIKLMMAGNEIDPATVQLEESK